MLAFEVSLRVILAVRLLGEMLHLLSVSKYLKIGNQVIINYSHIAASESEEANNIIHAESCSMVIASMETFFAKVLPA